MIEIEELISELNTISRLAIIENATITEDYIRKYIDLIKYKYRNYNKKIIGEQVIKNVKNQLEIYKIKYKDLVEYSINSDMVLDTVFLPHYCILAIIDGIVSFYCNGGKKIVFNINISEGSVSKIEIQVYGAKNIEWNNIIENCSEDEYFNINAGKERWEEAFGENSFRLEADKIILKI